MAQRLDEWRSIDARALDYHRGQWDTPKEMTKAFASFVAAHLSSSKLVVDMGCGAGGAIAQIAREHPTTHFVGLDVSEPLIGIARELAKEQGIPNIEFATADLYDLPQAATPPSGVVSMQTLSWLPDATEPLAVMFQRLRPEWLAVSSLFYAGDISCMIEVHEHVRERKTFYNCYSIPQIGRIASSHGYELKRQSPFEIGIDLPRPQQDNLMSTYTLNVVDEEAAQRRLQISGPLLMNWYFLLFEQR